MLVVRAVQHELRRDLAGAFVQRRGAEEHAALGHFLAAWIADGGGRAGDQPAQRVPLLLEGVGN